MAKYNKHDWQTGEVITESHIDAIENQLEAITPGATNVAPEYSSSTAYNVGQYVLYDGDMYRCTVAGTGNTPSDQSNYWAKTTVGEELFAAADDDEIQDQIDEIELVNAQQATQIGGLTGEFSYLSYYVTDSVNQIQDTIQEQNEVLAQISSSYERENIYVNSGDILQNINTPYEIASDKKYVDYDYLEVYYIYSKSKFGSGATNDNGSIDTKIITIDKNGDFSFTLKSTDIWGLEGQGHTQDNYAGFCEIDIAFTHGGTNSDTFTVTSFRRVKNGQWTNESNQDGANSNGQFKIQKLVGYKLAENTAVAQLQQDIININKGATKNPSIPLTMFQTVAVIGDSFASGHLDSTDADHFGISWIQILARKYGFDAINYSRGDMSTEKWLYRQSSSYAPMNQDGIYKMEQDIPRQLYFISLGINDASTITTTRYEENLNTIVTAIRNKNPNAVICFITPARITTSILQYSAIMNSVATSTNSLIIKTEELSLFQSEFWPATSGHPTAPQYTAMAEAYEEAFNKIAVNQISKLQSYQSNIVDYKISDIIKILKIAEEEITLNWEQGPLSAQTGGASTNTTATNYTKRCRVTQYSTVQSNLGIHYIVPDGFKLRVFKYSHPGSSSNYIYYTNSLVGEGNLPLDQGLDIRFMVQKNNESTITPSEVPSSLKIYLYRTTDSSLTLPGKAADAQEVGERLNQLHTAIDNIGYFLVNKGILTASEWADIYEMEVIGV